MSRTKKKKGSPRGPYKKKSSQDKDMINFEVIPFESSRIDPVEQARLVRGLDFAVKNSLTDNKHGIVIDKKFKMRAKKHLTEHHAKSVFIFHSHPSNKTKVVLVKKG